MTPDDVRSKTPADTPPVETFDRCTASINAVLRALQEKRMDDAARRCQVLLTWQQGLRGRRGLLAAQILDVMVRAMRGQEDEPVDALERIRADLLALDGGAPPKPAEREGWSHAMRVIRAFYRSLAHTPLGFALTDIAVVIDHRPGEPWQRRRARALRPL